MMIEEDVLTLHTTHFEPQRTDALALARAAAGGAPQAIRLDSQFVVFIALSSLRDHANVRLRTLRVHDASRDFDHLVISYFRDAERSAGHLPISQGNAQLRRASKPSAHVRQMWRWHSAWERVRRDVLLVMAPQLAPLVVLRGRGNPEVVARHYLTQVPAPAQERPRSVLDTLRDAPMLNEGDFDFARVAEDRVPDFTEDF